MERRDLSHARFRPALRSAADGKQRLAGLAACYFREGDEGTEYTLYSWPGFVCVEHLMPGCFDSALRRPDDVRALVNHDPTLLLGRTTAKTLRLSADATGLRYECDLPQTTYAADCRESLARGDMTGSSFSFDILDYSTREQRLPDGAVREIVEVRDLKLYDVSCVSYPAYEATSAGLRQQRGQHGREAMATAMRRRADRITRDLVLMSGRAAPLAAPASPAPRPIPARATPRLPSGRPDVDSILLQLDLDESEQLLRSI